MGLVRINQIKPEVVLAEDLKDEKRNKVVLKKLTCWEYMKCGREPGGKAVAELGICRVSTDKSFNGLNSGINGGRVCWAISGTIHNGEVQESFLEKQEYCLDCEFFKIVQAEIKTVSPINKSKNLIIPHCLKPYLNCMSTMTVKAGKKIITQGKLVNTTYIIQQGSCKVNLEKNGELYPLAFLEKGDLVGAMALLSPQPAIAHVDAKTDVELLCINGTLFHEISKEDHNLLEFMTELVTDRLDSNRHKKSRTIGKYIVTNVIGRGGYSIVYKGSHTKLNMPSAIKMLKHNMTTNPDFMVRFRNEASIIASLNHMNIIKIYDIEELYHTIFIIVEYLEGESMAALLSRLKTITIPRTVDFLIQICSGLGYAHKKGIVHQDIKPANLFIQRGDHLKILDFGIACFSNTMDPDLAGTVFYMAPEQIAGDTVAQCTDIYALGITAYEMVTGKRPFPEDDLVALEEIHLAEEIPNPAEIVPNLPERLRKFILKACRRDPNQRYQNGWQALEDLNPLAMEFGLTQKHLSRDIRTMTTLFLYHDELDRLAFNCLLEEFGAKAEKMGVLVKAANISNI